MQDVRNRVSFPGDAGAIRMDPPTVQKIVLLVDPDEDHRVIYTTFLRHCGYEVIEAKNGVEGILLARKHQPDVIVTELFVPTARGWKVLEMLTQDPRTAQIPILALTAYAFTADEDRAWFAGCNGFLTKPCEPARVVEEVQRLIELSDDAGWDDGRG